MKRENHEAPSIVNLVEDICINSIHLLTDIFTLFSLEMKLAGRSLRTIVVFGLISMILLLSSWFCMIGALVAWLVSLKISITLSFAMLSAVNFLMTSILILLIIRLSKDLSFRETRKQLELT